MSRAISMTGNGDIQRAEKLLRRQGIWNLVAAFIVLFAIIGIPAIMFPVLYGSIIDETGWSRGEVASFASIKYAVGAVAAFFTGFAVDRYGVRLVTLASAVLTGLALCLVFFINALWSFYLLAAFLGVSALGISVCMKIFVSRWFDKNQGLAVAIALMGISCAGIVIPMVTTYLDSRVGWRFTSVILSSLIWFVALPFFLWRATESNELVEQEMTTALADRNSGRDKNSEYSVPWLSAPFLIVMVINFLIGVVDHAIAQHFVLYLDRDVNFSTEMAAMGFALINLMSNFGKVGYGWLYDRCSVRGMVFCWAISAVGIVLLFPISGFYTLLLFAVVYGPTQGGMLVNIPVVSKHCFSPKVLAKTISIVTAVFMVGSAVGPALVGFLYDFSGSYDTSFILLIICMIISALLTLFLKPTYWKSPGRQASIKD